MEKFRVEFGHSPWGIPRVLLPQYLRAVALWAPNWFGDAKTLGWDGQYKAFCEDESIQKDTWYLAGFVLAHDSEFSGDWGMWERANDLNQARERIGWNDSVEFYSYYNPSSPFRKLEPADSSVVVSAYKAPKGWLIVALNDTDAEQTVTFMLPEEISSDASLRAKDVKTGKDVNVSGDSLTETLEPRGVKFILVARYEGEES